MSLRTTLGRARQRVHCALYRQPFALEDRGPIISFSFDDFPRTAYTHGAPILEAHGVRGTYYVAMSLMNTSNELGEQFRRDDLDALLQRGHELASHTLHHVSGRALSCAAFCQEVEDGRQAIRQATGADPLNFAYPFGAVTLQTKRALRFGPTPNGLSSARGIIPGLNGPELDLNLLRANSLYGGLGSASRAKNQAKNQAKKMIAENILRKTWLIFYTHDVQPNPSPYGCTPDLLEAVVEEAVQSGARVLTVQEALAEVEVQKRSLKTEPTRANSPDLAEQPAASRK